VTGRAAWGVAAVLTASALLAVGLVVPELAVDDGLEGLSTPSRETGLEAIELARIGCLDNPAERALTRAVHVASVQQDDVLLRTYTLFGIPQRTMIVRDGSVDCDAE
jgi:hypothetical protein